MIETQGHEEYEDNRLGCMFELWYSSYFRGSKCFIFKGTLQRFLKMSGGNDYAYRD